VKWIALSPLAILATLLASAAASAHPLGNFTVNRFSQVELSGDRAYVLYALDMAEIPTFQERQRIRDEGAYARALARRIGRGLSLTVDGRRVALKPLRHELALPPGVAGLRTLRLQASFVTPPLEAGPRAALEFRDTNFADRIGWKEIVLRGGDGARVLSSTVPRESISDGLLAYPKDLLRSPPEVTRARARFSPGRGAGTPPSLFSREDLERRVAIRQTGDGGFVGLIAKDDLSPGYLLLALLIAAFWGAAHAFSPGHGKAIVAGYLVGSRGSPRHAVLLGLIVTVTHTAGVFALGFVTLALSEFVVPEQLYPWLNFVSALLVVGVGLTIVRWRVRELRRQRGHEHGHTHGHEHGHGHHHHLGEGDGSARGLLGVGVSAGILPCPTALVVLLAAISLHRVGYGLVLILAFSVGLAASVTGIGLLAVTAKRAFNRMSFDGRLVRTLPAASALVVLMLGVAMTLRALPDLT
jgi:nickel/cobalt transporter (NicO) family protein